LLQNKWVLQQPSFDMVEMFWWREKGGSKNMKFRYEMHAHTNDVSICAQVTPQCLVEEYIQKGYTGVVLTNHMNQYTFLRRRFQSWEEKVDYFLAGYHHTRQAAGDRLQVLLGMELTFYDCANDYLVYGFEENFLYEHGDLMAMDLESFSRLAHQHGAVIYQAHPFRTGMTISDPALLDGMEVHNGNPSHDSRNDIAAIWAKKFGLSMVSGSDYHVSRCGGQGGILVPEKAKDIHHLVSMLQHQADLICTKL
jgi:hypothetical protein